MNQDWLRWSTIPASLDEYLDLPFGGTAIGVEVGYGTLYVEPTHGEEARAILLGRGGGFCWSERMSKLRLQRFLDDRLESSTRVRRGDPDVVIPTAARPR